MKDKECIIKGAIYIRSLKIFVAIYGKVVVILHMKIMYVPDLC